jgi:hypothetical protein
MAPSTWRIRVPGDSYHKTAPSPFFSKASAVRADLCRSKFDGRDQALWIDMSHFGTSKRRNATSSPTT